jgi:hypothetical protein|tara:strand:- start:803 stop:1048 length:246 start_codon:yes stop_codon:yes gene_type:complete
MGGSIGREKFIKEIAFPETKEPRKFFSFEDVVKKPVKQKTKQIVKKETIKKKKIPTKLGGTGVGKGSVLTSKNSTDTILGY